MSLWEGGTGMEEVTWTSVFCEDGLEILGMGHFGEAGWSGGADGVVLGPLGLAGRGCKAGYGECVWRSAK